MADDLFDAGVEDERQKLLAKQLAAAQALRGTAMPRGRDTGKMYVAANPLEMLGATIDRTAGRQREQDILGQQQALVEGKEQSRRQLGGEIQALPPLPVPEMLNTDEEIQKAQQSMGAHLGVANKALASADPGLKALGQQIHGDVKNAYAGLVKSREKLAAERGMETPEVKAALRMTLAKLNGVTPEQIPQEWSGRALKMAVDSLQKPYVADVGASSRKDVAGINAEARIAAAEKRAAEAEAKNSTKEMEDAQKKIVEFQNKYNPGIASARNYLGSNQNIIGRGNRIAAQVASIPGGNLIPQEMVEATAQMVGMLVGTNAPAVRTIQEMTPTSLEGDLAKVKQWLTNKPTGANQQEFVRRWMKTIAREQDTAQNAIIEATRKGVPAYAPYFRKHPDVAAAVLDEMGLGDHVDTSTFKLKPKAAVPSGPPVIDDEASYNALPVGAEYIHGPTGQKRIKKKG